MQIVIIFTVFWVIALTWARPSHNEDKQSLVNVIEVKNEPEGIVKEEENQVAEDFGNADDKEDTDNKDDTEDENTAEDLGNKAKDESSSEINTDIIDEEPLDSEEGGAAHTNDHKQDEDEETLIDAESFEDVNNSENSVKGIEGGGNSQNEEDLGNSENEKHPEDGDAIEGEGISKNEDDVDHVSNTVDITDEQAIENGEGDTENKGVQKEDDGDISLVDIVGFENNHDNEKHTDDGDSIENDEHSIDGTDAENGLDVVDEQEPEVGESAENEEDTKDGANVSYEEDKNSENENETSDENEQAAKDEEHQESGEDEETIDDILGEVNETGTQDPIENCLWHLLTFVMSAVENFISSLRM